jgi:PKD repeat protein
MIEAYLNDYPENILAVAGGYQHLMAGDSLLLDASRSIARKGHRIASYTWKLHNGRVVKGATTKLHYDKPGTYTEELIIKSASGEEDRDYIQVYVFNTQKEPNDFLGYFYPMKTRGIKAGEEVVLWSITKTKKPVLVDFGDGSPAVKAGMLTKHTYKKAGFYTVTFRSSGSSERPATAKMKIIVNK